MKWAKMYILLICCMYPAIPFCAEPDTSLLEQKTQHALNQAQQSGLSRFEYMRFYPATDTLPEETRWWDRLFSSAQEKQEVHALAIYLYNMYVSARTYAYTPGILSLNYVGVLDGLALAEGPLHTRNARLFYAKHYKDVNAQVAQFLHKTNKNWNPPTPREYETWLALLEQQPLSHKQVTYAFPARNLLQIPVPTDTETRLRDILNRVNVQASKQVIIYDVPDVKLENLDSKWGNNQSHRKRTYRWIKEECYYSTYLLGKQLNQTIIGRLLPWNTRVYMLSAYPKTGAFLIPATGNRFTFADGQPGAHWRYHTALLVIVPHNRTFVPVVLDPFLGGNKPLAWDEFLAKFHTNTVFTAIPFRRNNTVEKAIKTPSQKKGNTIWVDQIPYQPAPIEK